jgi:HAD superfamily hydrolase (TIGR01509 family)
MNGIRGVFFDLHGTLLISDDISKAWDEWREAFHGCMVDCGLETSMEEFMVEVEGIFEKPEPEYDAPGLSVFERRVMELCGRHGLEMGRKYMGRMVDHIIGVWYRDMYMDPEAQAVVEALRSRYRNALITNWDHASWIRRWLADSEIGGWFEEIVVSDEAGCAKPDPRIFTIALERLGLEPREMAYVGDSPEDVRGALAVGSIPILIRRDQSDRGEIGGDARVITRLSELLDLFQP